MTAEATTWRPTALGRLVGNYDEWTLDVGPQEICVTQPVGPIVVDLTDITGVALYTRWFWSTLELSTPSLLFSLGGIPTGRARNLVRAINHGADSIREATRRQELLATVESELASVVTWVKGVLRAFESQLVQPGWITRETVERLSTEKPHGLRSLVSIPDIASYLASQAPAIQDAIALWDSDLYAVAAARNEDHVLAVLASEAGFFNTIEKSPLTDEQARAVLCFDNRVQVIASAGSGKTSVMVAKAGWALHRNTVAAERILMLAFNKKAAEDLRGKLKERLEPLGFPAERIAAQTFHSFGLDVIGRATGRKPSLAPWLEAGDVQEVQRIVDDLRAGNLAFRALWNIYRFVFSRDLPDFGKEEDDPEDWAAGRTGFRTRRGEIVKSQGERLIADWLYFNGVNYEYESPYEIDTVDAAHSQYRPDFYYPDIDTYHEHFALDQDGNPPERFHGYAAGVAWKRDLHARRGTDLLETTMAGVWDGTAFEYLEVELTARGVTLNPDPNRPVASYAPIDNEQLIRTFRTFLVHAKSNRLTTVDLRNRLTSAPTLFRFRHAMFLQLFDMIREGWEQRLQEADCIDFEDMLNLAADHLESRRWASPFDLVMVDEMQDASHGRARLARALVQQPGRHLFAVGDDWQSINRFAGADLSVMTDFQGWFGPGETLRLQHTFRSPQSICDVSSKFVQKNPAQLAKSVLSEASEFEPTITALSVSDENQVAGAINRHLDALNSQIASGEVEPGRGGKATVYILGRYRRDEQHKPEATSNWSHLSVGFTTVHKSKGDEADYIVLPGMIGGTYGFPNAIVDDPVLQLAMPHGDAFPLAEERRLFYVAITRARRAVLLVTVTNNESSFLMELVEEHGLTVSNSAGETTTPDLCPACGKGRLVPRNGRYGQFLACTEFPRCKGPSRTSGYRQNRLGL